MTGTIVGGAITAALVATFVAPASAQPGDRNAIVYGARAPGQTEWHFGSLALQSLDSSPITFEIGVFFFRAQGYGLSTCVFKTYLHGDWDPGDAVDIVEDVANGVPTSGVDGRLGLFNWGAQTQRAFPQWGTVGRTGFRISSSGDSSDASAAGGMNIHQDGPLGQPPYETGDGFLGFRFNLTLAKSAWPTRQYTSWTPSSRINGFSTHNNPDSNVTTDFKASAVSDAITLSASWVPAPSSLAILLLGALGAPRRRRR